jgi:hypothetical protein
MAIVRQRKNLLDGLDDYNGSADGISAIYAVARTRTVERVCKMEAYLLCGFWPDRQLPTTTPGTTVH